MYCIKSLSSLAQMPVNTTGGWPTSLFNGDEPC